MTDCSTVMSPIIQSVRQLVNNFFGITSNEEDKKMHQIPISIDRPSFSTGDVVNVAPRMWPGINKPGGAAWITAVHENGESYDVKYILGGGSDLHVPAAFLRDASDLQEDRSQRTRRSKVRNSPQIPEPSQSAKKRKRRNVDPEFLSFSDELETNSQVEKNRKMPSRSIVFLATTLGEDSHALLRTFCSEFPNCRIVTKYCDEVTHVIVTSSLEKDRGKSFRILRQRTMKYLQGLLGFRLYNKLMFY